MKKMDLRTHTVSTVSDYPFNFDISKVREYVAKLQIDTLAITNHMEIKQSTITPLNPHIISGASQICKT